MGLPRRAAAAHWAERGGEAPPVQAPELHSRDGGSAEQELLPPRPSERGGTGGATAECGPGTCREVSERPGLRRCVAAAIT